MERSTRSRTKKTTNLTDLLRKIPQLQHISTDKINELVRYHTSKVTIRANEPLYKLGSDANCMFVIKRGKVLLDTLSGNVIKKKADYFGEEGLVSKSNIRIDNAVTMEECELYKIENLALVDYTETCLSLPTEASSVYKPGLMVRRNDSFQRFGNLEFSERNKNGSGSNVNQSDYGLTTSAWHSPWPSENSNGKLINAKLASKSMQKMESYEDDGKSTPFANNPALREFALKLDSQARNDSHAGAYGFDFT